jgi:hypothetical protein
MRAGLSAIVARATLAGSCRSTPADHEHVLALRRYGWICEEHPDKPMDHDGCVGAGMLCPLCNPSERDHPPDVGPGVLHRAIVDAQRQHFDPPAA